MEKKVREYAETFQAGDREIYCIFDLPDEKDGPGPYPTLILAHGYGGSVEDNLNCAERYARAGFAVCSLDFCGGSPISKSSGTTREMSIMTEKADMLAVFEEVVKKPFVRKDFVCLWGESQGGVVAALCGAELKERVRALILFYPAFEIFEDVHEVFGSFDEIEDCDMWEMPLGKPYFQDIWNMSVDDVYEEIPAFEGPVLLLHGTEDDTVPLAYSERAQKVYRNASYQTIHGSGHGFYDEAGAYADSIVTDYLKRLGEG